MPLQASLANVEHLAITCAIFSIPFPHNLQVVSFAGVVPIFGTFGTIFGTFGLFGPTLNISRSLVPYSLFLSHTTYK